MPASKYYPEAGSDVYEIMRTGKSVSKAAHELGVHRDTLYEWEKVYPDFKDYFLRARQAACSYWEDVLEQMALEDNVKQSSNKYKAVELILASRFRDLYSKNGGKQELEISYKKENLTDQELDKEIEILSQKQQLESLDDE